jgi:hypothetical protein
LEANLHILFFFTVDLRSLHVGAQNDKPRANENLAHLVDDLKKQAALARKMGDQSDDPERKKKFYDIANKLEVQ